MKENTFNLMREFFQCMRENKARREYEKAVAAARRETNGKQRADVALSAWKASQDLKERGF